MKRRSFLTPIICAVLSGVLVAGSFTFDVKAVARTQTESTETTGSTEKTETTTTTTTTKTENGGEETETTTTTTTTTEGEEESDSSSNKKNSTGNSSSNASTKKSTTKKSSTPKIDENGNTILMTQSQRRKKWLSKTNPKRGEKIPNVIYKPNYNGFTYADFSTCNSYNSENGLGGRPIYLLGTITDIEKVYENTLYYGVAVMVNDCDGYQWYMRANVSKNLYEIFRNQFLGKSGYIYGIYSGYSGVTNRPMMDITVIHQNGVYPVDMKSFK